MNDSKITTLRLDEEEVEMLSLALEVLLLTGYAANVSERAVSKYVMKHGWTMPHEPPGKLDKLEDRLLRAHKRISSCPERLETLSQSFRAVDHD